MYTALTLQAIVLHRIGKKEYVDLKHVVWHQSFFKLLETIKEYSVVGCWVTCGDGVKRHLFPIVLILSADYEEQ